MLLPITPQIAGMAVDLPEHHSDPQDRIIIATALAHEEQLMSADRTFPLYEELARAGRVVRQVVQRRLAQRHVHVGVGMIGEELAQPIQIEAGLGEFVFEGIGQTAREADAQPAS